MMKDKLAEHGIVTARIKPGRYQIDCPKPYCKQARIGNDNSCLTLEIKANNYAHWKCSNCMWSGSIGVDAPTEKEAVKQDKPLLKIDPDNPIVLCAQKDYKTLTTCGVQGVHIYTENLLKDNASLFKAARRIIISLDNTDEMETLRLEIIRRVGAAKCWNVKFYGKTIENTYKNHGIDYICQDVNEASPHPIKGLYEVDDFITEVLTYFEGGMKAGVSTGWPNVDELYTVLPGQFTVVTGIPNSGKSTWLDALAVNLATEQKWMFGVFSPENPKALHAIKLAQKKLKLPSDPKSPNRMSMDSLVSGISWVKEYFKFIVSDSMEEPPTLDWILARASDAVLRWGIRGLIIDPWNRIVKKYDNGQTENSYVEHVLAKILRFCLNHDVHVWLVAHPTKQEPDKKTGKFGVPSLYSISGGANFPNMMDNGVVIFRPTGADSEHVTEVWVRKVRFDHVGKAGHTNLKYEKDTGNFSPMDEPAATYMFGNPEEDDADHGIKVVDPT